MLQFTQKEIESELKDILKHGDVRRISLKTGIGETYLDGQFNPNDERKSPAFLFLQIQCALDEIDPERGDEFWESVGRFREMSKNRCPIDSLCASAETGKLNKEVAEYISARIEGKPFDKQFSELLDIEAQIAKTKKAMLDEYNRTKNNPSAPSLKLA